METVVKADLAAVWSAADKRASCNFRSNAMIDATVRNEVEALLQGWTEDPLQVRGAFVEYMDLLDARGRRATGLQGEAGGELFTARRS